MKGRVTLYVGGTTFEEVVHVAKFEDAKKTALAKNPTAKVVAMNPIPLSLAQSKAPLPEVLFYGLNLFSENQFRTVIPLFLFLVLYLLSELVLDTDCK